ncbi:MAG: glycosyltransferase family 4 protein [Haloarculaceae archaeon]
MHILRVAQQLYPDHTGGGAYHIHALSRDQAAMGHDVTVLTLSTDQSLPTVERRDGYRVLRERPCAELIGNQFSPAVWRRLRNVTHDVVHAHSHLYASTNLAAANRVVDDRPLAVTNHGVYSQSAPQWLFTTYLWTLGRVTFNRADRVFCYTAADERRLRSAGVDAPVTVVPNGIDTGRFTPEGPVHDAMRTDRPVVLFVGRLVDGKNPDHAVDAVARLRARDVPVELVVCGEGPRRESLERRVAERGVSDDVRFLGDRPYEAMPSIYRGADLLVLPSRAEGFPRSVLEAFASGVPAVTSDLEQLRGVVPAAGRTVPLNDVSALADALGGLFADPGRRETLGRRGRRLAVERFRWSRTVERTTARLQRLCDGD